MSKRADIENKIIRINNILINSRKLAFDSYVMLNVDSSAKHELIFRNKFLMRTRENLWKLSIIELTKIIGSKKEDYQIVKILNFLLNNYKNLDWKTKINKSELIEMQDRISNNEIKKKIEKVIEIRNQHYAHKDAKPTNNIFDIEFYYEDFEFILETAENIMERLTQSMMNENFVFDTYTGEEANNFFDEILETNTELGKLRLDNTWHNNGYHASGHFLNRKHYL